MSVCGMAYRIGSWFIAVISVLALSVSASERACAIGRSAGDLIHVRELLARIGNANDDHPMMQQRRVERSDRGLLAAMLRSRRDENAPDFADQASANPQSAGATGAAWSSLAPAIRATSFRVQLRRLVSGMNRRTMSVGFQLNANGMWMAG